MYSSLCSEWGYEPMPVYHEPEETPISSPQLLNEYPLILKSAHEGHYVHSQDRHLTTFRREKDGPVVIIHPDTAARWEIADGDIVYIKSKRGRIR
jgi:anaerobic selenocysteine-containing dehydrogenase